MVFSGLFSKKSSSSEDKDKDKDKRNTISIEKDKSKSSFSSSSSKDNKRNTIANVVISTPTTTPPSSSPVIQHSSPANKQPVTNPIPTTTSTTTNTITTPVSTSPNSSSSPSSQPPVKPPPPIPNPSTSTTTTTATTNCNSNNDNSSFKENIVSVSAPSSPSQPTTNTTTSTTTTTNSTNNDNSSFRKNSTSSSAPSSPVTKTTPTPTPITPTPTNTTNITIASNNTNDNSSFKKAVPGAPTVTPVPVPTQTPIVKKPAATSVTVSTAPIIVQPPTATPQQPTTNEVKKTAPIITNVVKQPTPAPPQTLSQSSPASPSTTNLKPSANVAIVQPLSYSSPSKTTLNGDTTTSSSTTSSPLSGSPSSNNNLKSNNHHPTIIVMSPGQSNTMSPAKSPSVPNLNDTIEQKKLAKRDAMASMETEARGWVCDVLQIKLDESISFQEHFKSGVLLCKLINTIKPGAVRRINESTISFKQLENIQNYLHACTTVGMLAVHLFNSIDLHEDKDIGLVITNVLVLGKFAARVEGYTGPHLAGEKKTVKITTTPSPPLFVGGGSVVGGLNNNGNGKDGQKKSKWRKSVRHPSVTPLNLDISTKEAFKYSPELERSAAQWIEDMLGHKLPYPSLRTSLKDGILLCKVVNRIEKDTIKYINTGKSGFKQMENIANYLNGCQQLGLKRQDLFDTTDLYEEKNVNLVISNIHVLANHVAKSRPDLKLPMIAQSQSGQVYSSLVHSRFGMPGSAGGGQITDEMKELMTWINGHTKNRQLKCEDISNDLNNGVILLALLEELTGLRVGIYMKDPILPWHFMQNIFLVISFMRDNALSFNNGSISAHDIFNGNATSICQLVKIIRENFDRDHFFQSLPVDDRRQKVVEEIIVTEQTYVRNLSTVFHTLIVQLELLCEQSNPQLTPDDIYSVFGNWESILKHHVLLLTEFENRMESWNQSSTLGDIFINKCGFLADTYSHYINNYDNSYTRIKRLRKANKTFDETVDNFEVYQDSTNGLDLYSYLIMPIQRIPRYLLLLKEVIKYTPSSHTDYAMLVQAKESIRLVADQVNENKMMSDNTRKINSIQDSIFNIQINLNENERRYIREGFLEIEDTFDKNSYFFLFNDILLFVKYKPSEETGKEFKFKEVFNLSDFVDVCDILSDDEGDDDVDEDEEEDQDNKDNKDGDEDEDNNGSEEEEIKPKRSRVTFAPMPPKDKLPKFEIETNDFSLVLIAESEEEKVSWMDDIRKCLQTQLIQDDDVVSDLSLNDDEDDNN